MSTRSMSEGISSASLVDSIPGLDLNLLMLFLQIMSAGSISQTALRLHTSKATLSRKLRQLERQVGAVLAKRGPVRLETTDIGEAILHHCERIAAELHDTSLVASEMQSQVGGKMRITMPIGLANTWVSRALTEFASRHPRIRLSIHVTNRPIDMAEEPYDVAICIGRIRNESCPARKLVELPRGVYASPAYCDTHGSPKTAAQLSQHNCIVLESQLDDGLWPIGEEGLDAAPRVTTTDIIVAREMAVAGIGIAMLTPAVCDSEVKAGRLVRLLADWELPPVVISAVFLERRHMPLRTRAFIELLAKTAREPSSPNVP